MSCFGSLSVAFVARGVVELQNQVAAVSDRFDLADPGRLSARPAPAE